MISQLFAFERKLNLRRFKGRSAPQTVVQQVTAAPVPTPPKQGDAAKNITPGSIARQRNSRRQGRIGTILAPQGTLEDRISSLLGS